MNSPGPPPPRPRQTQFDLNPTHRLPGDLDPLPLAELLGRQRRPEIRILRPQKLFDPSPFRRVQPPRRLTAALARDQPRVPKHAPSAQQTLDLPNAQTKTLSRLPMPQKPLRYSPHHMRTLALRSAHRQKPHLHETPPHANPPKGTFSRCANTRRENAFPNPLRAPILPTPLARAATAINGHRNRSFGPGGGTRRLHPSPLGDQAGFGGGEIGSTGD